MTACARCPQPLGPKNRSGLCTRCRLKATNCRKYRCAGENCDVFVWKDGQRCRECDSIRRRENPHQFNGAEMLAIDAEMGSARLQERVEALFARTARRRKCSVEAAKLTLLYSPAQIEKMAA